MATHYYRFFSLFLTSVLLFQFSTFPVFSIEYGGIGGRPAFPRSDEPRTSSIFIHTVNPGQIVEEGIYLVNNTAQTKTLMVYSTDSTPSTDGGFACKQQAETKTGVGAWVNLDQSEVSISPNSKQIIPFKINVPQNAEVGEQNGCIVIQEKKSASSRAGINLSFRTGLRVALTVPGDIIKRLVINKFQLIKKSLNVFIFRPEIQNLGNVSVQTDVSVIVKDIIGRTKKEFGGGYPILRGDTSRYNFEFHAPIWGGIYTSSLKVSYHNGHQEVVLDSSPITFFVIPDVKVIIISLLALLPVLTFIVIIFIRHYRLIKKRKHWLDYQVKKGDTLNDLAQKINLTWKELAVVNRIKAPYVLKAKSTIKVPKIPR